MCIRVCIRVYNLVYIMVYIKGCNRVCRRVSNRVCIRGCNRVCHRVSNRVCNGVCNKRVCSRVCNRNSPSPPPPRHFQRQGHSRRWLWLEAGACSAAGSAALCQDVYFVVGFFWCFFFLLKEGISLLFDVLLAAVAKGSSVQLQPQ